MPHRRENILGNGVDPSGVKLDAAASKQFRQQFAWFRPVCETTGRVSRVKPAAAILSGNELAAEFELDGIASLSVLFSNESGPCRHLMIVHANNREGVITLRQRVGVAFIKKLPLYVNAILGIGTASRVLTAALTILTRILNL
jgi:hypothetical protein